MNAYKQWMRNQWICNQWMHNQWMRNTWMRNQWMRNQWMHNQWMGNQWRKEKQTTEIHHTNYFCISILLSLPNRATKVITIYVIWCRRPGRCDTIVNLKFLYATMRSNMGHLSNDYSLKSSISLKNSLLYAPDRRGVWCFKSTNTCTLIVELCTGNQ
jgi:hypothetical protein